MATGTEGPQDFSTNLKDWRIGVISTDYDLRPIRKALLRNLRLIGFTTVAFEQNDFPVQPHLHSHTACLKAVSTMDIVVLVLDKRYGGLYLGAGDKSITEREFWSAFERKAVIIPCVSRKLFDDRDESKKRVKELIAKKKCTEEQAKIEVLPTYADGWKLIDFLDRIQHADRDQFMVFYDNSRQLVDNVKARLAAITPHFCRMLIKQQMNWVDSQRSTTGLFESLGHISSSRLYVGPPSKISGCSRKRKPSSVIEEMVAGDSGNILITASPGGGKTVELVRAFKLHAKNALKTTEFRLPFYVPLKGKGLWHHFDFEKYINESFADYLKRKPYPCFDARDLTPVFYVDGLDEGPITPPLNRVETIVDSPILQSHCIMTARSGFARLVLDGSSRFASRISTRAELLSWTKKHASLFAGRYLKSHDRFSETDIVLKYIQGLPETHPIIKSPLIISLLLWLIIAEGADNICSRDMGLSLLFELFLQTWANRELSRHGHVVVESVEADTEMLLNAWEMAAWSIFRAREKGENLTFMDLQNEIEYSFVKIGKANPSLSSPAFKGLIHFSHGGKRVAGLVHDQFMEYLLARWFVRECTEVGNNLVTFLSQQVNVDVNRFIKSIWASSSGDMLKRTLCNLEKVANKAGKDDSQAALMAHANCVYYLSRVPMVEAAKTTLRHLLKDTQHLYCRNGILFALLRLGDLSSEHQLYKSLSTDAEADRINRGLHLEYFKDAMPGELGTPPIDNGDIDWERCLLGLIDHIDDNSDRFALSRRVDLYTIYCFLKSRGKPGPLTPERLKRIRLAALSGENMQRVPNELREGVSLELKEISKMVRRMRRNM